MSIYSALAATPPLVLLHPLGSTGAMSWTSLAESLRGAGHRVAAPDLPGHGNSRETSFTWEHARATVHAAAEALGPENRSLSAILSGPRLRYTPPSVSRTALPVWYSAARGPAGTTATSGAG